MLKFITSPNADVQAAAAHALAAIKPSNPDLRRNAVDRLLKLTDSDDPEVQSFAIEALGALDLGVDKRELAVPKALLKAAASNNSLVQKSAAAALAQVASSEPDLRKAIINALLSLVARPDPDVQQAAAASLLAVGPIAADEVASLLAKVGQDGAPAAPKLRAIGWAFNGASPMANEGAVLLAFAGSSGRRPCCGARAKRSAERGPYSGSPAPTATRQAQPSWTIIAFIRWHTLGPSPMVTH